MKRTTLNAISKVVAVLMIIALALSMVGSFGF
jgi:hypothetical protein